MARRGDSVIGIDLGKHVFKGVSLRHKSDSRLVLTNFASREVPEEFGTTDQLAQQLRLLLRELGGNVRSCALAISHPAAILRIIEQPSTPIDLLRNALRLNGLAVLNQECKDFVLDCAPVSAESNGHATNGVESDAAQPMQNGVPKTKYLVGGMLRPTVKQISEACAKTRVSAVIVQRAPICSCNAL